MCLPLLGCADLCDFLPLEAGLIPLQVFDSFTRDASVFTLWPYKLLNYDVIRTLKMK